MTPTKVFNAAMAQLQQDVAANHNSLSFHITGSPGGLPHATVHGRAGNMTFTGQASVSLVSDRTAHGSKLVVFSAFWAPAAALRTDQAALASVAACYQPRAAELFQVVRDSAFTYSIPPGWTVAQEGQDTLTIALGSTAGANYLLTFLPPTDGIQTPAALLSFVLRTVGVNVTKQLVTLHFPSEVDQNGAVDGFEYVEFTGTFAGGRSTGWPPR